MKDIMEKYCGKMFINANREGDAIEPKEGFTIVQIYGNIPCGALNILDDGFNGYMEIPNEMLGDGEFFALRAEGDSMIGAGICDGDLVIIRKQSYATKGQIVVAFVDGETTLKRFYPHAETKITELRPENENYDSIITKDCTILGVAVKVMRDL